MRYLAVLLVELIALAFGLSDHAGASQTCITAQSSDQDGNPIEESTLLCLWPLGTWTPVVAEAPIPSATPTATPIPPTPSPAPKPSGALPTPWPAISGLPTPVARPTRVVLSGTTREVGPGRAFASIGAAVAILASGDTVSVHAGTYPELVTLNANSMSVIAYGDGPVWIDGQCTRQHGITINGDDVLVRGLGIKKTIGPGLLINGDARQPARAQIESNTIQDYNCTDAGEQGSAGIAAYYSGAGQRIVGNTITRRVEIPGPPRGQGNGIWFKSATGAGRQSGGGHYIAQNVITGGWDGIGGEVESDAHGAFDQNSVIELNVIRDCADDGIQIDGGAKNVHIRWNDIRECGFGGSFAPVVLGPAYVYSNFIESSTIGLLDQLGCFKVGNDSPEAVVIVDNTCHSFGLGRPNTGKGIQETNPGSNKLTVRGNRWIVDAYAYEFQYLPGDGSVFNGNCFQTTDPSRFVKYGGQLYGSLAAFQNATRQELNGKSGPC